VDKWNLVAKNPGMDLPREETIGHELGIEERISEKIAINKGV